MLLSFSRSANFYGWVRATHLGQRATTVATCPIFYFTIFQFMQRNVESNSGIYSKNIKLDLESYTPLIWKINSCLGICIAIIFE
jgi:hypothetical protein